MAPVFFGADRINMNAKLLHTRTRPSAWATWAEIIDDTHHSGNGQDFEHFYFSLQAAVAGLGVAIGPWKLVQNDIRDGLLVAPQGFREDGSAYFLLSARELQRGSVSEMFGDWLRAVLWDERTAQNIEARDRRK
jgi:DNA-binding transcriptional LysR family regulator